MLDNEAAYLAGVAAAKTTKTKQVGFVGGIESEVISRFAAGFKAGVESVDPSIKVQVDYAGSFGDAAKGKTIAAAQYAAGADVVYQAARWNRCWCLCRSKITPTKPTKTKSLGYRC